MIIARLSDERIILGLTEENLQKLRIGMPIMKDLKQFGGSDTIIIVYGETSQQILEGLAAVSSQPLPMPKLDS